MKSKLIFLLTVVFFTSTSLSITGQTYLKKEAEKIVSGCKTVFLNEKNKSIKFLQLSDDINQPAVNKEAWLKMSLKFTKSHSLKVVSEETDKIGVSHTKFQIYYKNLPVEWAVYTVHSNKGRIISANGEYILGKDISVTPNIKEPDAFNQVIKYVNAEQYKWESENTSRPVGELIIMPVDTVYILAYKFDIYAIKPLSRQYIYVNANSRKILKTINRIQNTDAVGTAKTMYSGSVSITTDHYTSYYRLREVGRDKGIETYNLNHGTNYGSATDFTDNDNNWTDTIDHNNAAYDAHYGTEATYDYYLTKFGRKSYDNLGSKLISYVHYDYNYVNAFWDGTCMTYGDGDGITYLPLTPIEVTAHEITHGVTEHTANLIYAGESGALNESFSDIFGTVIDFYKHPLTANYLMGDAMSVTHTPFRSMQNPNAYGDPDTYHGLYWDPFEEVHTNSGVQNFWFYLLCEGGTGTNDIGHIYSVNGIGRDKAAAIAYRTLTVYLSPSSNYADARFYSIKAANDLFGECSPEAAAVTNAWYAVGVGTQFNNAIIANFSSSITSACKTPTTICFYNKSTKATSYLWNFGDGATDTSKNPVHSYTNPGSYNVQLIASGSALCNNKDTLLKNNYITVANGQSPVAPSCIPHTINPGTGGIYQFSFNTINNVTGGSLDNYQDYSCTDTCTVTEGREYPVGIKVGNTNKENIYVWLDLNNDGLFNNSNELILQKNGVSKQFSGNILIPAGAVYNTPLRLRIASDFSAYHLDSACSNSNYGQIQDYAIQVRQNTSAPEVEFTSNAQNIVSGDTVKFFDRSLNLPVSWSWSFPGGEPSTSTESNPRIAYNSPGTYDVKLIVSNTHGTDSLSKIGFIKVTTPPPIGLTARITNPMTGEVNLKWYTLKDSVFFEDFEDGVADNFIFSDSSCFKVEDGYLKASKIGDNTWKSAYYNRDFQDFTFEYSFRREQGDISYSIGSFIRADGFFNSQNSNGYLINVIPYGSYGVWKLVNGNAINLIPWTSSSAINPGLGIWNVVDIEAIGDNIKIYVNGQYVNEFTDNTFTSGKVNVCANFAQPSTHEVWWDYMKIFPGKASAKFVNLPKATNTPLTGENVITKSPVSNITYNPVEVKGLMNHDFGSINVFKYYNIYRDSLLIDSSTVTSYIDTLPKYGKYNYMVTSMYDEGESTPTGPASVTWTEPYKGEACWNAQNLADLSSPYSGTILGYKNDYNYCYMSPSPDRVFYVDLQNSDSLIIGQIWNDYDSRYSIRYGGSCPGDTEIICNDDPDIMTHIYVNNSGATQRIYWIQGGCSGDAGNFILAWNVIHSSCPKPKKLTADSISYHSAQINWQAGNSETKWDIEWGLKGFTHGEGTLDPGLTTNSYSLTGLILGTNYDFFVRAICDSSDKSWWMGPLNFYTKGLDKPVNLKAIVTDPSAGAVELTWEPKALGINEDFEDGIAQNWKPVTGNWRVVKGVYLDSTSSRWSQTNTSYYDQDFANFEYEAKMRSVSSYTNWTGLYFNGDPGSVNSSGEWMNGYLFIYSTSGYWELAKASSGMYTELYYGSSPDIRQGLNTWNSIKVKYADGNIECYINGALQGIFFDSTFTTGKVGLFAYHYDYSGKADFDDVKLTPLQSGYVFGKVVQSPLRNIYKDIFDKNSSNLIGQEKAPIPTSENPYIYKLTDSAYFRVYRDDILIDSTYFTNYSDTLTVYGKYNYKVSAVYTEGESKFAGPVSVGWYGNPLISVKPSSFNETLLSGDSVSRDMTIKNNGIGKLIFKINSSSMGNSNFRQIKPIKISTIGDNRKSPIDTTYPDIKSRPQINMGVKGKNVLIFRDNLAWGFNVNVPILDSMGANVTIAGSSEMGTISLKNYQLIIFESQQPTAFYNTYVSNINRFNSYLSAGGVIEFHCATYTSYRVPSLPFPGGMKTLVNADDDVYNYIVDPTHPIVKGIVGPLVGSLSSLEAFQNLPAGAIIITNNESSLPTTVEYKFGAGTVIATGMPWEWAYAYEDNYAGMLPNAFRYALTKKLTSWLSTSPVTDTLNYGDSVNVTVKFNAKDLVANTYSDTLKIISTDLIHPTTNVPCVLTVLGKPTADFSASATTILFGDSVHFTDLSIGIPTSWKWEFPGGTPSASTLQNPTVTYFTDGTYDVNLIATNAYGSDTVIKTGFIKVRDNLYCISNLGGQGYCPGDITNFSITGSILNNTNHNNCSTANNSTYGSYPASGSTTATLVNGQYYTVSVTTSNYDIISIWIDYNHNQIFEASEWRQVTTYSTPSIPSTVNILVPADALKGTTGLRIRSNSNYYSNGPYDACANFGGGITEDYTITIDNSVIPDFTANTTSTCRNTSVIFTNTSIGSITSYNWNFGSGASPATASSVGPHIVEYTTSGYKTVSLTVNGTVVKTRTNYITVTNKPNTPIVTGSGNLLVSSASAGNQWYTTQYGIINSATSKTYAPQIIASYYVIVTLNGCSSDASNVYLYTDLDVLSGSEQLNVYPIPVTNALTIKSNMGELSVKLIGVAGEIVYNRAGINTSEFTIDMSKYSSGVYILNITSKNKPGELIIRKILKK